MRKVNMKFVEHVAPQHNRPRTIKDITLDAIQKADDGLTMNELYNTLPEINPRQIRLALQDLKASRRISFSRKCRCNCSTVYEVMK